MGPRPHGAMAEGQAESFDGLLPAQRPAVPVRAGRCLHDLRRLPLRDAGRHQPEPGVPVDRAQRCRRARWWPGDRQLARQLPRIRWASGVVPLDQLCRTPAAGGRVLADLPGHGRQLHRQPSGRLRGVPSRLQRCTRARPTAARARRQHAWAGAAAPGCTGRAPAAGQFHHRRRRWQRTSRPVQSRPGRGLYRARAGRADCRPGGLESYGTAADVRRERRLLRPHAATGTAFARGRRLGRCLIGQYRRRVSPSSGTGR